MLTPVMIPRRRLGPPEFFWEESPELLRLALSSVFGTLAILLVNAIALATARRRNQSFDGPTPAHWVPNALKAPARPLNRDRQRNTGVSFRTPAPNSPVRGSLPRCTRPGQPA